MMMEAELTSNERMKNVRVMLLPVFTVFFSVQLPDQL
jgi:hypothetical protein